MVCTIYIKMSEKKLHLVDILYFVNSLAYKIKNLYCYMTGENPVS